MDDAKLDTLVRKLLSHAAARDGVDDYEARNILRPLNAEAVRLVVEHAVDSGLLIRVRRVEVVDGELAGRWVYQPWKGGAGPGGPGP